MKYGQIFVGAGVALFGVFIGFAVATEGDPLAKATWWDLVGTFASVFAAVGTVAATAAALYFGLADQRAEMSVREARLTSVLWIVDEAVQTAQWIGDRLTKRSDEEFAKKNPLPKNELSAFLVSMDSINRIPFHEEHFAEGHRALIHVLGALRSLSPWISDCLEWGDNEKNRHEIWSGAKLAEMCLDEAKGKEPCKDLDQPSVLYAL